MSRTVYLNGQYLDENEAKVSVFDRGFLFADAVYEVTSVINGRLIQLTEHLARLERSCAELQLKIPLSLDELRTVHEQLVEKNQLNEGGVYLQLSRGNPQDRDFAFPAANVEPTLVMFTQTKNLLNDPAAKKGIKVVSMPEQRWLRRDIKTTQLLSASLAKEYAKTQDADDTLFIENGFVTEASSSNAFIITENNTIVTRPLSHALLPGITRQAIIELIKENPELTLQERSFSIEEAKAAKEMFFTSATTFVRPVVQVDGHTIADGQPGNMAIRLRELYISMAQKG